MQLTKIPKEKVEELYKDEPTWLAVADLFAVLIHDANSFSHSFHICKYLEQRNMEELY